jgi:hypothetical protein
MNAPRGEQDKPFSHAVASWLLRRYACAVEKAADPQRGTRLNVCHSPWISASYPL